MIYKYLSPFGVITFKIEDNVLTELSIPKETGQNSDTKLPAYIKKELDLYFSHQLRKFTISFKFIKATPFQIKVWNALLTIEYGTTKTYQDIAIQIKIPKAAQAVGQACKKNPLAIIIPCHRVIGKDFSMRGYSGPANISLKQKLIEHEEKFIQ